MKTLILIFQFWKLNLLSAMEYKMSFFTQVFMMILNDFLFFTVWIFFFKIFGTIGWLKIWEYAIMLSIMVMVFWIVHTFFNGYYRIAQMIEEGKLDSHLLLPKNILVRTHYEFYDDRGYWRYFVCIFTDVFDSKSHGIYGDTNSFIRDTLKFYFCWVYADFYFTFILYWK